MATTETPVFLKDQNGTTHPFTPKHAARTLAYPGTQWSEVNAAETKALAAAEVAEETSTKPKK